MKLFNYELPRIPEFCQSHWLIRLPLIVVFLQQGIMKLPLSAEEAASYGLSYFVWWFVAYGEILGGIGLIIGGLLWKTPNFMQYAIGHDIIEPYGDFFTRFSGIVLCCIMTGVIWIGEPASLMDVIMYDNLHVFLWVGALFFALRGNRAS